MKCRQDLFNYVQVDPINSRQCDGNTACTMPHGSGDRGDMVTASVPVGASGSSSTSSMGSCFSSLSLSKAIATLMKPPSPAAPGLNISKYLSIGTASRMSSTKMPAWQAREVLSLRLPAAVCGLVLASFTASVSYQAMCSYAGYYISHYCLSW